MTVDADADAKEARFVQRVLDALIADADDDDGPPIVRHKLRAIRRACGREKLSAEFLIRLQERFDLAGLHASPRLDDTNLRLDDPIRISTQPVPPYKMMFPTEATLRDFVESNLGIGVFERLTPARLDGKPAREFPVGRGRIDLLCRERLASRKDALVVIELKRDRQRGTVEQIKEYIDAVRKEYPGRSVRGIIVSGRENRTAFDPAEHERDGYDIRWYCYHVDFE